MLIGLDPLLGPDLLWTLRAMGHGDTIAIVDANFPAQRLAKRLYRGEADAVRTVRAILSVLPVDTAEPNAVQRMAAASDKDPPPILADFEAELRRASVAAEVAPLTRQVFYDHSAQAFAIVATAERRLYGNLILTKGVIVLEPGP